MKKVLTPLVAATLLASAQMVAAASSTPPGVTPTWLLFGDSIMSTVYPSVVGGPQGKAIELTATRVTLQSDIIIRNLSSPGHALGGPGHSFSNGVELMREMGGLFSSYNGTIVQALTNDFGLSVPVAETKKSLNAIILESRRLKRPVIVMDAIWRWNEETPNKQGLTLESYRNAARDTCNLYPGTCYFFSREGTVFNSASAIKLYTPNETSKGIALHLNAEGHRRYADWMILQAAKNRLF